MIDISSHEEADVSRCAFFGALSAQILYPALQFVFVEYAVRVFVHIWEEEELFLSARGRSHAPADLFKVEDARGRALDLAFGVAEGSAHDELLL